jgi:hypothetical protein
MECRRCLNPTELPFRVETDALNVVVCPSCAEEARRLGLPVEAVSGAAAPPSLTIPDGGISQRSSRQRIKNRHRAGAL